MKRQGRTHIRSEEIRGLFRGGRPVLISTIAPALKANRSTVTRQMRRHRTLTSINRNAAFCVLPEMCRFDRFGFSRFGKTVFFRDGNQSDAIVRLVSVSEKGMEMPEISAAVGSRTAMQVLNLVRAGRLTRQISQGRFVYFAGDAAKAEEQKAQRKAAIEQDAAITPEESLGRFLAEESRESIELLVKVLLTCLRHPRFSAKSVALSLIRRGEQTCTEQVLEFFARFALRGKNC